MIHYENMTKEQVIGILKDAEEYIGEVHKDYDIQKKEMERLKKLVITLSKNIQELSCNEEELELLNNILGSDKK